MLMFVSVAALDATALFNGLLQFLLVVGISFAGISLITSFLRFQLITGAFNADVDDEELYLGDETAMGRFQVEVLRRMGGGRSHPPPFVLFTIGLRDRDKLISEQGEGFLDELQQFVLEKIREGMRTTDRMYIMDGWMLSVIASPCEREKIEGLIQRVLAYIHTKLYRSPTGWSGHLPVYAGCVSFPENGITMQQLMDLLEEAAQQARQSEELFVLAEIPEPEEEEEPDEDDEDDEDEEEDEQGDARVSNVVDPLTGVMRSDRIGSAMQKYMAAYRRENKPVSMLFIDIDRLGKYRKQYGDEVIDSLLAAVGVVLQRETREVDLLGRYEDESFVVMFESTPAQALVIARRLCTIIRREPVKHRHLPLRMTVRIGVAGFPDHGRTPRELFHFSQCAADEAGDRGGDSAVLYDSSIKKVQKKSLPVARTVDRF